MRYIIPPKNPSQKNLVFIPYWRMRGKSYTVQPYKVSASMIDTSLRAAEITDMPETLGLRAQTQVLRFASPKMDASFLDSDIPYGSIHESAEISSRMYRDAPGLTVFHRAFVGETISKVFAPVYVKGSGLFDALLNKPIAHIDYKKKEALNNAGKLKNWKLNFLPAQCPHCGWDLEGQSDNIAYFCKNCDSAWLLSSGKFKSIPFALVKSRAPDAFYAAFWRIRAEIKGIAASSYADIIRLANLPKIIRTSWEDEEMYFWFPAFKLNPRAFIRLSRIVTFGRPGILFKDRAHPAFKRAPLGPVNIPPEEAAEALITLIASVCVKKKNVYPILETLTVKPEAMQLYFLPFVPQGGDYIQPTMNFSIQKSSFRS
jgi:predicted Zn-ribbon and HTH transcriptional regulator